MNVHHLNCGILHAPPYPPAACHCLLLENRGRLTLVDTGIGLLDVARPQERLGQPLIEAAGFQFHASLTAARQIERLGFRTTDVLDIVLTHADPDHSGGLADFPAAAVHISEEEHAQLASGAGRYVLSHFAHQPRWTTHAAAPDRWFGLEARPVSSSAEAELLLIPLFGHTRGHCGVALRHGDGWLLHVGDAYYLRVELEHDEHPVSALAALRAEDEPQRRASLQALRRLAADHAHEVAFVGYHDITEFPPAG